MIIAITFDAAAGALLLLRKHFMSVVCLAWPLSKFSCARCLFKNSTGDTPCAAESAPVFLRHLFRALVTWINKAQSSGLRFFIKYVTEEIHAMIQKTMPLV